jgi:Fe-S cluster biogenesis protein NfuA
MINTNEGGPADISGPPVTTDGSEELMARIEELMVSLDEVADPQARAVIEEILTSLMELYGEGLGRIFTALSLAGTKGNDIRDALLDDGVVASLLLIHGLYPVQLEARVNEALDSVRPYLESHRGDVELVSLDGDVALLRLKGSCDGCPASASTLELAIKQALEQAAPDLLGIEVEGMPEPTMPVVGIGPTPRRHGRVWRRSKGLPTMRSRRLWFRGTAC